ncbi:MAG: vWA domain-containing protein [Gemmatimonadaceae bacterium]
MTLTIQTDRSLIRAQAESTRYILARINAPTAPRREQRIPVNVGLVLDRSGSMGDERKFTLAREAVERSLAMLREEDRFSLVVYDTEVDVLARSTHATAEGKRRALEALRSVGPRGGTDLGAGWLRGCEQVSEFLEGERVSRCLLLTDGLANHGIVDRGELAHHAGELRRLGVATSTFGVGADFDERLLRDMAHEGGGNFYFIEGASQIPGILTGELGEALEVTIRGARLVVRPGALAHVEVLNRFRSRRDGGQLEIELGDLVSGQELDVVVKVVFPRGEEGSTAGVEAELLQVAGFVWTYASHDANDAQPRNREVDRAVAQLYAARARAEATEANREGRYDRARRVLEATARRIREYAGDDRELVGMVGALNEDVEQYEAPMTAAALKRSTFVAEMPMKGRDYLGRARRRS